MQFHAGRQGQLRGRPERRDRGLGAFPGDGAQARVHRGFLARAVRRLAEEWRIDQFIELGSGMPIQPAVHEIAGRFLELPRVVYVDNDPVVVSHNRALLDNGDSAIAVHGDLRTPRRILDELRRGGAIDFGRPFGLLCGAVLHFVPATERVAEAVGAFRAAMAPGSGLVISHACGDHADPQDLAGVEQVYARANAPLVVRTRMEIAGLFAGFDLAAPGLTEVAGWPQANHSAQRAGIFHYGGAARFRARVKL